MPDFMLTKKVYKLGERFTVLEGLAASFTIINTGNGSPTVEVYVVEKLEGAPIVEEYRQ